MAPATVDNADHRHISLKNIPRVDLRLLSHSELLAFSRCVSSRPSFSDEEDDESTPKIDPSVFNESAGSRKQTFYRLRLAPPRGVHNSEKPSSSSDLPDSDQPNSTAEDLKVMSVLKSLFSIESKQEEQEEEKEGGVVKEENLVPVDIGYTDYFQYSSQSVINSDHNSTAGFVFGADNAPYTEGKKKRGRPRKFDNLNNDYHSPISVGLTDGSDIRNSHISDVSGASNGAAGVVSSVEGRKKRRPRRKNETEHSEEYALLGSVEDPFAEEITRRTEGFQTQEQMFGFVDELNGEWVSAKKKRKIVDAGIFGNSLPEGWKLMLCMKRNGGHVWLVCQRYISPNGQQFVSWKEVTTYFLSISQPHKETQLSSDHISDNIQLPYKLDSENTVGGLHNCKNGSKLINWSTEPNDMSKSEMTWNFQEGTVLKCHKCPLTFTIPDEFLHHLYYSHKKNPKKLGPNVFEAVIMKDGKYECQLCQKSFEEKRRYDGHLGIHIKMYVKRKLQETQTNIPPPDNAVGVINFVSNDSFVTSSSASNHGNMASTGLIEQPMQQEGSTVRLTASNDKLHIFKDKNILMSGSTTKIGTQEGCSNGQTSDVETHSSSCFPSFDILMDKVIFNERGDPELFRMVENPSSFGALTSDNTGMEYDFLRAQMNNFYSEDPKVVSYDTEMDQDFDSSTWFEKENSNLLPKTGGSHQVVNACVWCGDEIQQEALDVGPQMESIGFMCNSCKAKYPN